MAVLPDVDRRTVLAEFMRRVRSDYGGITKTDLQAAINAADVWADSNAASFNTALPLPARTSMIATDKSLLLCYVIMKRQGLI